jgi:hypothetical protein
LLYPNVDEDYDEVSDMERSQIQNAVIIKIKDTGVGMNED